MKKHTHSHPRLLSLFFPMAVVLGIFTTIIFGQVIIRQSIETFISASELSSNIVVRGVAGDLWADIVLGKRDFTEISPRKVVANKLNNPGGVVIDARDDGSEIMYIWDSGNSRIVATNLDQCKNSIEACQALFVIGQPNHTDFGACNQDSSGNNLPNKAPASAGTLCGMRENTQTTLEEKTFSTMFIDEDHNLYVADKENNRVLKYNDPFATDQVADDVWGQENFSANYCNRRNDNPRDNTLCFEKGSGGGVVFDSDNNMWVADAGNNRVLRFPYNEETQSISKNADRVIGQPNFETRQEGNGSDQMKDPSGIAYDKVANELYVADGHNFRIQVFALQTLPPALAVPVRTFDSAIPNRVIHSVYIIERKGVVSYERITDQEGMLVFRSTQGEILSKSTAQYDGGGGLSISKDGTIFGSNYFGSEDIAQFTLPSTKGADITVTGNFFAPPGSYNSTTPDRFEQGGWGGIVHTDGQLIVADGRLFFYNDPLKAKNGQQPDGFVGRYTGEQRPEGTNPPYAQLKVDKQHHLYVVLWNEIHVYQTPLTVGEQPIKIIKKPFFTVENGGILTGPIAGIAVSDDSKYLWISDSDNNRVLRVRDPLTNNPRVDVVLGQVSTAGKKCNRDENERLDTLCYPGFMSFDRKGNLYISDHSFELRGNHRLLMFKAGMFPENQSTIFFGPKATKSFPRGNFNGEILNTHMTFEPAFNSQNHMIVGTNPYSANRYVPFYLNPTAIDSRDPENPRYATANGKLGDYYGWPVAATFDDQDNLYVFDTNRGKVMIYLKPNFLNTGALLNSKK